MNIEEKSKISKEELEAYLAYLELMGLIAYLDAYREDDVDSSGSDTEERTDREEDYDTESEEEYTDEPVTEETIEESIEEEPEEPSEETYDSETSVEEDTVE